MGVYIDELRDWGWRLGPSCHMIADTNEELHEFAATKYGMYLRHDNGRDHLIDAYQEILDLAVYLRNEIERRRVAASSAQAEPCPLTTLADDGCPNFSEGGGETS